MAKVVGAFLCLILLAACSQPEGESKKEATSNAAKALTILADELSIRPDWAAVRSLIFCKIFVVGRSRREIEFDMQKLPGWSEGGSKAIVYRFGRSEILEKVADQFVVVYDNASPDGKAVKIVALQVIGKGTPSLSDGGYYPIKYMCTSDGVYVQIPGNGKNPY